MKCGITTFIENAVAATPTPAIAPPRRKLFLDNAYQMPMPAITSGISSFVSAASPAKIANGTSRSSPRYQKAYRSSGQASATGWKSLRTSHWTGGKRR